MKDSGYTEQCNELVVDNMVSCNVNIKKINVSLMCHPGLMYSLWDVIKLRAFFLPQRYNKKVLTFEKG